jgi:ABC-type nitrate/sulfonate/bicarbonate transport system permease component
MRHVLTSTTTSAPARTPPHALGMALEWLGRRPLWPLLVLAVLGIGWELLAGADQSRVRIIPAPSEIGRAMLRTSESLLTHHIPETLTVTLIGIALSVIVGLLVAAALDYFPMLRRAVYPLLIVSQTIPIIALATVLLLLFGFDMRPKVAVVVLFCFFPITVNTLDGLAATNPVQVQLLRALGGNEWQVWRLVRLPAALPAFFSGLRIAATYSVTGAITGEYVTSQYGLGQYLRSAYSSGKVDQAFAAIAIVAALSVLVVFTVSIIERLVIPWFFARARELAMSSAEGD